MNLPQLHRKLIAASRSQPPRDHVPYAFEKRISALIQTRKPVDLCESWARALWRASAPCVAVTLLLLIWSFADAQPAPASDLGQEFDAAVLAAAYQDTADIYQ